jgi:hypothetical protein
MKGGLMRSNRISALVGAAMLLGGCSTLFGGGPRLGPELAGRSVRLVPAQGQASTLHFRGDGVVRSTFGRRSATGRWWVRGRKLCFLWAGSFRECWPYSRPFQPGRTVALRSDRGNRVRATLL